MADPAGAAALYRATTDRAPGSRLAARARTRLSWLEARSEGGYGPLRALLEMRARPLRQVPPRDLAAFARRVARFPPGRVRREAYQLLGESWRGIGRLDAADAAYRAWLAEPGLPASEKRLATSGLAQVLRARGEPGRGARLLERAGLGNTALASSLRKEARRRILRPIAYGLLGLFLVAFVFVGGLRGLRPVLLRRAFGPGRLFAGAWVAGVPLAIATLFDRSAFDTFATASAAWVLLLALASIGATALDAAGSKRRTRIVLAALVVLAQLAASYLVLDHAGLALALPIP